MSFLSFLVGLSTYQIWRAGEVFPALLFALTWVALVWWTAQRQVQRERMAHREWMGRMMRLK
jgi:hypothetical protein